MKQILRSVADNSWWVLIGPCGIETESDEVSHTEIAVLIGPCGIETYSFKLYILYFKVLIGPCGIETSIVRQHS